MSAAVMLVVYFATPAWAKSNTQQPQNQLSHPISIKQQQLHLGQSPNVVSPRQQADPQHKVSQSHLPSPTRPVLVS